MKVFRALRTDELPNLLSEGITAQCDRCPEEEYKPCCYITPGQHINSGSRAIQKSRYISTTESEQVAAWYCSNTSGNPLDKSATYAEIEFDDYYFEDMDDYITKTCDNRYGATADNRAKSSCEVLVKDFIPRHAIVGIYRVKIITKGLYDKITEPFTLSMGKRLYNVRTLYSKIQNKDKYMLVCRIWGRGDGEIDPYKDRFPDISFLQSDAYDEENDNFSKTMSRKMSSSKSRKRSHSQERIGLAPKRLRMGGKRAKTHKKRKN
ncbi:MAG: hypothetical protein EB127_11015 [Alphaproteobacteria bacterium]|nr:hypothetical protein [Alphaproteobacteria bacterium]